MFKASNGLREIEQALRKRATSFAEYAEGQLERTRALLRRTLDDPDFQDELLVERENRGRGYPARSATPLWALDLAALLRNAEGRYSPELQQHVYEVCSRLYEVSAPMSNGWEEIDTVAGCRAAIVSSIAVALASGRRTAGHGRRVH